MMGGLGWMWGGECDVLAELGRPSLDPSMLQRRTFSRLRMSGPSLVDSGSGAGIVDVR